MSRNDNSPIALVQNPAINALLLWNFSRGYQLEKIGALPEITSLFLVLPLILHGPTMREIKATYLSSGLSKLIEKLAVRREQIISIHDRALVMRELTLTSIAVGVSAQIFHVEYETGLIRANEVTPPKIPERLKYHLSGAEKLGRWFARMPSHQVFSLLQVSP